ncbi:MAG: long-chain fatty acid--CoA ligase [bacterium]|nr:long-chain fatty acid--CoA ligase [bacterium]
MSFFDNYPISSSLLEWAKQAELTTLPQVFKNSVEKYGNRPYLGSCDGKQFKFKTYNEVYEEILTFASALLELKIKRYERVANFSVNRVEWPVVDFGTVFAGGVHVPMYPTLSADEMAYIVNDCEARFVAASGREHVKKIIESINKGLLPRVEHIISMDKFELGEGELKSDKVRLWSWQEFMAMGADTLEAHKTNIEHLCDATETSDICSFVYTSGTTGQPKGAMLMNGNFVSQAALLSPLVELNQEDVELSFLPLSHVFERVCYYALTYRGSSIGYTRGIRFVPADLKILRPTLVPSVPRLFEKIFAKIVAQSGGGWKDKVFNRAIKTGRAYREAAKRGKIPFLLKSEFAVYNATVFAKIRKATGGRVRYFISGGASARVDIIDFFLDASLIILEGYGLTETSPVICLNLPQNINPGTVGEAIPGLDVKLTEDGELCVKGPNVMRGYFKLAQATAEVFDRDGYFHTGDIAEYNPETKCYTITDRKKEIIVLSNGKNVAPAPLENAIKASPYIEQVVVVGNNRSSVGALVVPNFEKLEAWAAQEGLPTEREKLIRDTKTERLLLDEIAKNCQEFSDYEKVHHIAILPRELKESEGEITPTLKVKRRIVRDHFGDFIDRLYARPSEVLSSPEGLLGNIEEPTKQSGDGSALKEDAPTD